MHSLRVCAPRVLRRQSYTRITYIVLQRVNILHIFRVYSFVYTCLKYLTFNDTRFKSRTFYQQRKIHSGIPGRTVRVVYKIIFRLVCFSNVGISRIRPDFLETMFINIKLITTCIEGQIITSYIIKPKCKRFHWKLLSALARKLHKTRHIINNIMTTDN